MAETEIKVTDDKPRRKRAAVFDPGRFAISPHVDLRRVAAPPPAPASSESEERP